MLKEAIQKHYDRLSIRKEKFPSSNLKYLESDDDFFNRLSGEFQELKRHEGRNSVVYVFDSYFQKAKRNLPKAAEIEILKYALEEFKLDRTTRTPYGEEALNWYNSPIETIVDKYGEFLAYEKHLYVTSKETRDSSSKKGVGRPKANSHVLKWKEECIDELKHLYKFLTDEEEPWIEKIGYKEFEEIFFGKKSEKIVWLKQVGLLIYLLDNLYDFMEDFLYISKDGGYTTISSVFKRCFLYKQNGKIFEIKEGTIYPARSRFLNGQEKGIQNEKNFKKIQTVIQQLKELN